MYTLCLNSVQYQLGALHSVLFPFSIRTYVWLYPTTPLCRLLLSPFAALQSDDLNHALVRDETMECW